MQEMESVPLHLLFFFAFSVFLVSLCSFSHLICFKIAIQVFFFMFYLSLCLTKISANPSVRFLL